MMRIRVTSERYEFLHDGDIVEVPDGKGKYLLDSGIGVLLESRNIETAQSAEPETATRKRRRGRPRNSEVEHAR